MNIFEIMGFIWISRLSVEVELVMGIEGLIKICFSARLNRSMLNFSFFYVLNGQDYMKPHKPIAVTKFAF